MNGYKNEYDFIIEFNNKKVRELNPTAQELIYSIFKCIKKDDLIRSWRNHYSQKTDISLKINNIIKGISIKMGSKNSVHVESIKTFNMFLSNHGIPKHIINEYLKFHYADGTLNNTGNKRLSAEEYKINNQAQIDEINKYFNDPKLIIDAIDRFVLRGNNSNYSIDAIIYGTPEDYLWITKNDIIDILTKKSKDYSSSPHFSKLTCQPMNRCINRNIKYEKYREYIQIKWYSLFDDIIEEMNAKFIKTQNSHSDYVG